MKGAMFQNFVKQSFDTKVIKDKTKIKNLLGNSIDRLETDFNFMTQGTFDLNNPKYSGSYVGMKKGNKTVIKEPSLILASSKSNILNDQ